MKVTIIGGGLAGSEAAWQLAKRDISVELFEMRPTKSTKAHKTGSLAELVCSNSFRGAALNNAVGLLKEELKQLDSLIMKSALHAAVPAGGALAVDREVFSSFVDSTIRNHDKVTVISEEISSIPEHSAKSPVIIATGPLTSPALTCEIEKLTGKDNLAFFDAISPIILGSSIDQTKIFRQSRYDKGGDDYLNIPLNKEQYYKFIEEVNAGEKYGGHDEVESDSIENLRPFEGCMPIEEMIARGPDTLLFGPLKPVGLTDPLTGRRPYAVIQLRQDDKEGRLWSMVGFQTRLKQGDQQRIFSSLPGLEKAEFVRLGSVHRNTFIDSPKCLDATLQFRNKEGLFFAGQITGVEGYVESTAAGLVAGLNACKLLNNEPLQTFPTNTAIGSLLNYISDPERKNFQPMNISFGLFPSYDATNKVSKRKISKKERRENTSQEALETIRKLI